MTEETITHDDIDDFMESMAKNLSDTYDNHIMDILMKPSVFQTDKKIKEIVPAHTVRYPKPYIYKNEYSEIVLGFHWHDLFSFGKKEIERFAYRWEVKGEGETIKFRRYGDLKS